MDDRMWTYPELRFVYVNQHELDPASLAIAVNDKFHSGESIRTALDIDKIKKSRNIFNKNER